MNNRTRVALVVAMVALIVGLFVGATSLQADAVDYGDQQQQRSSCRAIPHGTICYNADGSITITCRWPYEPRFGTNRCSFRWIVP